MRTHILENAQGYMQDLWADLDLDGCQRVKDNCMRNLRQAQELLEQHSMRVSSVPVDAERQAFQKQQSDIIQFCLFGLEKIEQLQTSLICADYARPLVMTDGELVNDYHLENCDEPAMDVTQFQAFRALWRWPPPAATVDAPRAWIRKRERQRFRSFKKRLDKAACTEWFKTNRHGVSFGGFYLDHTIPRDRAWFLTFHDNARALWELPYPKAVVMAVVRQCCANQGHSVRYVNWVCEWIYRKGKQLQGIETQRRQGIDEATRLPRVLVTLVHEYVQNTQWTVQRQM